MVVKSIQQLLNEAIAAQHELNLGKSARVVVDQNGERVEYTAANSARLSQYIDTLYRQLNGGTTRGPLGVIF